MKESLKQRIHTLYHGSGRRSVLFRYALLIFDISTIVFLFVSSFFHGHALIEWLDPLFGVVILCDFLARVWIAKSRGSVVFSLYGIADILVILSLLAPLLGENLAFLRVIRMLRLLRSYEITSRLREDFQFFRKNQDVIYSAIHLFVFLFVMTAMVFETQVHHNAQIQNYADALYFTVTALTTTGFGDITLKGQSGRMLAVIIMIVGVSLFLRLLQTVFRPNKVRFPCEQCGLILHDRDAIHCKHCGNTLAIPSEGFS